MNLVENREGNEIVMCDDCLSTALASDNVEAYWSSHKKECSVCGKEEDQE